MSRPRASAGTAAHATSPRTANPTAATAFAAQVSTFFSALARSRVAPGSDSVSAGLPFKYQMVPRDRQIVVPKYLRPRTDTPKQTVGYGGCFSCIYSVRGAGGYQMFGITPAPIYDPTQSKPDFTEHMVFMRPGDMVKFRGIDRDEYDQLHAAAEAGEYRITARPVAFDLQPFLDDPDGYNKRLLEVLA